MSSAPPPYTLTDPFPHSVFHRRHPVLVQRLLDAHPYGPAQRTALNALLAESLEGVITPLADPQWHDWDRGHVGQPWAATPFLWAESYFYRRLLEAVGYFETGVDPFGPFKAAELVDLSSFSWVSSSLSTEEALTASLYGNRADLGFQLLTAESSLHSQLVTDDTAAVVEFLLADHLLSRGCSVVLHVKPYPYFVSDATFTDVHDCLRRLRDLPGGVGDRLHAAATDGPLSVRTHPFHVAPLSFADMPADLAVDLGEGLTIFKGDLNYRRLVGDLAWEPTTSFRKAVSYLPGPAVALRILKSDVVVGADPARIDGYEEGWRTSGNYALVSAAI
ncbi:damage-control phosphatase ARMT1 family protein [Kibdelosporangium lantanae]|uniref:Damage-control phosphatase ARMT1 family protein n=1 Tax=Kibdelosporangium lantanae TaxID=1497396 RepID=A0ABW3MAB8_9PSEU